MRRPSPRVLALLAILASSAACGDTPAPRGTDTPNGAGGPGGATGTGASGAPGAGDAAAMRGTEPLARVASEPAPSGSASAPGSLAGAPASSASAGAPPTPDLVDLAAHPTLLDAAGKPLPQTDDAPSATSPAFRRRMELLWEAIVKDDPSIATDAVFFPKVAYAQVKDIPKPEADWKSRLVRAFERNVHGYHRKLGDRPEATRLVGVEIDEKRVKVMARGKEGNKLPYHRVTRSKIRYVDGAGAEKTLELTSLIAWRGEWFVVHLDGFK